MPSKVCRGIQGQRWPFSEQIRSIASLLPLPRSKPSKHPLFPLFKTTLQQLQVYNYISLESELQPSLICYIEHHEGPLLHPGSLCRARLRRCPLRPAAALRRKPAKPSCRSRPRASTSPMSPTPRATCSTASSRSSAAATGPAWSPPAPRTRP